MILGYQVTMMLTTLESNSKEKARVEVVTSLVEA